jgi:hypothetical protein
MQPDVFDSGNGRFSAHVTTFYDYCRRNDVFLCNAVTPPQGTRGNEPRSSQGQRVVPSLAVVAEDDTGITVSGIKMLATSAAFCDEIWIGNIVPLAAGHESKSITCVVRPNAPGACLWSRKPYERYAVSEFDNYLACHFDESDCMVARDKVKVPWERVFVHDDVELSRESKLRHTRWPITRPVFVMRRRRNSCSVWRAASPVHQGSIECLRSPPIWVISRPLRRVCGARAHANPVQRRRIVTARKLLQRQGMNTRTARKRGRNAKDGQRLPAEPAGRAMRLPRRRSSV